MKSAILSAPQQQTDIYTILGEPHDPASHWAELRYAQLSSYDYIFLSANINSKLANKTALSDFMNEVYQIMETCHERAKVFIYSQQTLTSPEFASFTINWQDEQIKDFHINTIKDVEQKNFIRTLFDHSGMLIGNA
ncbi:hypothetical protein [Agarilytica rhodophyticola]|uniref:hypothetical protein n=1 Tax=Agarilytica rhodophyticola TaxID=1737490 RepID=UPI000B341B43|nr:hypothetical protein [Agarilytica rhodophyticola]